MRLLTWLRQNWKAVLSICTAVLLASYGAVQDVKGEITSNSEAIRALDISHTKKIDSVTVRIDGIEDEVRQSNCILVAQVKGEPAVNCIPGVR